MRRNKNTSLFRYERYLLGCISIKLLKLLDISLRLFSILIRVHSVLLDERIADNLSR
ncbi:hypothetical protein D3C78_1648550 [compost metagenome]